MGNLTLPLIRGDKVDANVDYRDALPVNMFAVRRDILEAKGYMLAFSGLERVGTAFGADRAGNYNDRFDEHYRVSGQTFCRLNVDGTVDNLGAVPGSTQCATPYSFNTQCVISDGNMYLYDAVGGFRQVVDADLGSPIDGVWVNGYYFMTDGEYIFHTDIDDESSIDPLKFKTAEFMPDKSLGVGKTQDNKIIVFGRYTLEYFYDEAAANFAFTRIESRGQKIGIVATHAKCEAESQWFITGSRKEESLGVHMVTVGAPVKVSSREVDEYLETYTEAELSDMRMEARTEHDSSFVYVHLPNETLVYNLAIAKEFGSPYAWCIIKTGAADQVYRGINGVFDSLRGYWVYGDKVDGRLGHCNDAVFTQYGEDQEWYLYSPLVGLEAQSINSLEIETLPGHNITADATVAMSITYDGVVYSTEWWELYGELGGYSKRFIIRRLGYVPHLVGFRFRGVTSSRMAFLKLGIDYG